MEFSRPPEIEPSSNRAFGCVMAGVLSLVALFPLLAGKEPRQWLIVVAVAFFLPALLYPAALGPLNKLWTGLGHLLSRLTSPVALAVLFFVVITPYGWLMKRLGKSHIPTGFDPAAESYWITREPPGPKPESLRDQF